MVGYLKGLEKVSLLIYVWGKIVSMHWLHFMPVNHYKCVCDNDYVNVHVGGVFADDKCKQ